MSVATQSYISTLVVYAFIYLIASWGFDLQVGVSGILNLSYILFQAVGAYTAAIFAMGPATTAGDLQTYAGGWKLPFPLPLLVAVLAGGAASLVVGIIGLRRLRTDYLAIVLFVVSVIGTVIAEGDTKFLNGPSGLSLVPQPWMSILGLSPVDYNWFFAGFAGACCLVVGLLVWRLLYSPLGRVLRAMRENEEGVRALGRNTAQLQLLVFVLGGMLAALSGGLLVEFITAWSPAGWLYLEIITLFAAVVLGGRGNPFGVAVGAVVVYVGIPQAVKYLYLPPSEEAWRASLEWIVTGLLVLVFLWMRPQGILPERRRRFRYLTHIAMKEVDANPSTEFLGSSRG